MNKLTAIEWLRSQFIAGTHSTTKDEMYITLPKNALKKALEMEEKQNRIKWQEGWDDAFDLIDYTKKRGLEIKKNDLKRQLFIGKVSEIIGPDKTIELLKEVNNEI